MYKKRSLLFRFWTGFFLLLFVLSDCLSFSPAFAQSAFNLPEPGTMVRPSEAYPPALLRGVRVDNNNPLLFDFLIDMGKSGLAGEALESEGQKLIKYFLTALTVPESELWVNLSPYEGNRIVPDKFGVTEMGRDLLAQDYILKQLTASLSDPETSLGKEFWQRVYSRARQEFGTADIPMSTFNKVWITPDRAKIFERSGNAYIVENHLKVMLEQDYLSMEKNQGNGGVVSGRAAEQRLAATSEVASDIVRQIIIPELTREVNEGKNFARLRQIYNSLLLAAWYKKKVRDSILGATFLDKNKVSGAELADKSEKERIYERYVEAFRRGAYNMIKEEVDVNSQELLPRKYFSGGASVDYAQKWAQRVEFVPLGEALAAPRSLMVDFKANVLPAAVKDAAMNPSPSNVLSSSDLVNAGKIQALTPATFIAIRDIFVNQEAANRLAMSELSVAKTVRFQGVKSGVLPRGYAVDKDRGIVYVSEATLNRQPNKMVFLARLAIRAMAEDERRGEEVAFFLGRKFEESEQNAAPDREAVRAQLGKISEGINNVKREFFLNDPNIAVNEEKLLALAKDGPEGITQNPNAKVAEGRDLSNVLLVNIAAEKKATQALYVIGNAVIDRKGQLATPSTVDELVDLFVQQSLVISLAPAKYAPTTDAHISFGPDVLALGIEAGVESAARELETTTFVLLPNVTYDDFRKPFVMHNFAPRHATLEKIFKEGMEGLVAILQRDRLYDSWNGEEVLASVIMQVMIKVVNKLGLANLPVLEDAGDITPARVAELRQIVSANQEKYPVLKHLLRFLYQVGGDHFRAIALDEGADGNLATVKMTYFNPVNTKTKTEKSAEQLAKERKDFVFWAKLSPMGYRQLILDQRDKGQHKLFSEDLVVGAGHFKKTAEELNFNVSRDIIKPLQAAGWLEEVGLGFRVAVDVAKESPESLRARLGVGAQSALPSKIYAVLRQVLEKNALLGKMSRDFVADIEAARDEEGVLNAVNRSNILPQLDTAGKLNLISRALPFADVILAHTNRGAASPDRVRDTLISENVLKVMNVVGFSGDVAATNARIGILHYLITGEVAFDLLGIVPRTGLAATMPSLEGMQLLLRQDNTRAPLHPRIMYAAITGAGMSEIEAERTRLQDRYFGADKGRLVETVEVGTPSKDNLSYSSLTLGDTTLRYNIFLAFDEESGQERNIFRMLPESTGDQQVLAKMQAYAKERNSAVDAAQAGFNVDQDVKTARQVYGGIDFALNNVDLDITATGPEIRFNFDPALLNNGNFDGMVPVIMGITPVNDLPLFLGVRKEDLDKQGTGA